MFVVFLCLVYILRKVNLTQEHNKTHKKIVNTKQSIMKQYRNNVNEKRKIMQ